jgi:nitroreductase
MERPISTLRMVPPMAADDAAMIQLDSAMPPSPSTLSLLKTRRSPKLRSLVEPGPSSAELDELLTIAARVPDHGKLVPWRFVIIQGAARSRLSEIAASSLRAKNPAADPVKIDEARTRFSGVPLTVVVVSSPRGDPADPSRPHPSIPRFEQELSAGAVCMNYLVAAKAMGFAAVWLTEWYAADAAIQSALAIAPHERIAGFLYTGTEPDPREDRPRPVMSQIVSRYEG